MTNKGAFDVSAARAAAGSIAAASSTSRKPLAPCTSLPLSPAWKLWTRLPDSCAGTAARNADDSFIISKGHGSLAQYAVLESLGIVSKAELDLYGKPGGRFATHPDYGLPGIEASTGSLGMV
jgi:transketolase